MPDSKVNILVSAVTASAVQALNKVSTAMKNVDKSVSETSTKMSSLGSKMKDVGNNIYSIGSKATLAISMPLATASKKMVDTGASMKAMHETFKTVFGDMTGEAQDWSKRFGQSVGLSSGIVDETNLQFRKMAGAFGMGGSEALAFSEKWTQLTMDLSAFSDIPIDEATERMMSGLRGEADAVEKLGIFMGEANLKAELLSEGLKGQYSDLKPTQKMTVLYNLAIKQTAQAHGQAQREAKSYQNAVANLKQTYKDFSEQMFKAVEPALLGYMNRMNEILASLKKLTPEQLKLIATIATWLIVVPPIIMYLGMFVESCGRLYEIIGVLGVAIADGIGFAWFGAILAGVVVVSYLVFTHWNDLLKIAGQLKTMIIDLTNKGIAMAKNEFQYLKEKSIELKDNLIKLKDEAITKVHDTWRDFIQYLQENKAVIETVSALLLTVFAPALAVTGIKAVIAGTQIAVGFISKVITAGVEAVVSAGKIVVSFVASMLRAGVIALIAGGYIMVGFVQSLIKAGIQAVVTAGAITISLISALVEYAVEGWFTVTTIVAQTVAWVAQEIAVIAVGVATYALNIAMIVVQGTIAVLTFLVQGLSIAFAFLTSPIGLAILAIAAIIAIGVALYKNWDTIKVMAQSAWKQIGDAVTNEIDYLKGRLQDFKDWFKDLFKGIKLPSFSFSGSLNPVDWASSGMPKVNIEWHADGGIFTKPTLFGNQGVGEAGAEAIIPLSNRSATAGFVNNIASGVVALMPDNTKENNSGNVVINVNGGFTVREEADIEKIGKELYKLQQRENRRMGRSGI